MRKIIYILLAVLSGISSCKKDGTEKRCDKGYTGKNCDQEITPSKIQITYIETTKLPPFDTNGSNWDPLGGKPDVYFRIVEKSSGTVIYKSGSASDVNTTLAVYVDLSNVNVLINSPQERYNIEAWDYDTADPDDYMGSIEFTPYTNGQQFHATKTLECSGCNTGWKINCTYLF